MTNKVQFNPKTKEVRVTWDKDTAPVTGGGDPITYGPSDYLFDPTTGDIGIKVGSEIRRLKGPVSTSTTVAGKGGGKSVTTSLISGKPVNPLTTGEAFIGGTQQGATLGWSDEIEGAGKALADKINGQADGLSFVDDYKRRRDDARSYLAKLHQDSPWAYGGGTLAGGLLPALAAPGSTPGMATMDAATIGGLTGSGFSNAPDAMGQLRDTAAGTGVGLAAGSVGGAGQFAANRLLPSGRAVRALGPLQNEVDTAMAQPGVRPAETSPELADALRSSVHASPVHGSKYLPDALSALDEGYDRMVGGVGGMLSPDDAVRLVDQSKKVARANAAVQYPDAYSDPATFSFSPTAKDNPFLKDALPLARKIAKSEGRNLDLGNLNTMDVHNIRQSLDDLIESAYRQGNGNAAQKYQDLKKVISIQAYKANPKFEIADQDYALHQGIAKAADAGMDSATKSATEVQMEFAKLSPVQQQAYKVGLATYIRDRGGTMVSKRSPENLLSIPEIQQKMAAVGVRPEEIDQFVSTALGKAKFADAVASGSATGKNVAFRDMLKHPAENIQGGDLTSALLGGSMGGPAGAVLGLAPLGVRAAGRSASGKTANYLIDALASPNPNKLVSLYGRAPQAYARLRRLLGNTAATGTTGLGVDPLLDSLRPAEKAGE